MNDQQQDLLSREEADLLVLEHQGWAESIARSVARAWNLDWQLDGLDGAAMEALIFCARRFKPGFGVPFKGYSRKRIHEAATEAAKKTRGWRRTKVKTPEDKSREISAQLLDVFPELREGELPETDESGGSDPRSAVRQLLVGASLLAAKQESEDPLPDQILDYKRMILILTTLDPVHQLLMYRVYWDGISLRTVASEWDTDGLNVIREHKTIVDYLFKELALGKQFLNKPKVRPGLKEKALDLKQKGSKGPFTDTFEGKGLI
jgi:DNA-directed RNA polymerase specialized sigma subunit